MHWLEESRYLSMHLMQRETLVSSIKQLGMEGLMVSSGRKSIEAMGGASGALAMQ